MFNADIGATSDLSLRLSVAVLVRVLFKNPGDGEWMLALERKATLYKEKVEVRSQPFGRAIRLLDLDAIHDLIGDFRFDGERSRAELDFRLFIRPSSWSVLREFCIQHLSLVDDLILEIDPARELVEEFDDALKISLKPEQYVSNPVAALVENEAVPTDNIHTRGIPTVRVYRIFEATISDPSLARMMMANSESLFHQDLCELALEDAQNGGKGRANAVLVLPFKLINAVYLSMPTQERNVPILFERNRLDETVSVVLDGITAPKYQRL